MMTLLRRFLRTAGLSFTLGLTAPMVLAQTTAPLQTFGASNSDTAPSAVWSSASPGLPAALMRPGAPPQPAASASAAPKADQLIVPEASPLSSATSSEVFGANLFTGAFARPGASRFNPDYLVAIGDVIQVRLWGAYDLSQELTVDPRGNIFLPHVGAVPLLGVRNQDLQRVVEAAVARAFRSNVGSYASLTAAQPVRVFVTGFVPRPGLYSGTSMDSLLHYLDQAGGIDTDRGSFLNVQVKRGETVRTTANLYDFLLEGRLPLIQLSDGDVIFVPQRQNTVRVTGLVENAKRFEFTDTHRTVADLIKIAKPLAQATHVRVLRNTGTTRNTEYFALDAAANITLANGDELEFTADKKPGTITVRVEGEHNSAQEYVLPNGAKLGELINKIQFSERSDTKSLQLFRRSVKERQKLMLQASLRSLETAALTARSGTNDEAGLRKEEATLLLQWVDRAKKVEPAGQVLIAEASHRNDLPLENGDVIRVPAKDGLVLVNGEVLFPNAIVFDTSLKLEDYIARSGGYTQNANVSRIVIAHRDGSFSEGDEDTPSSEGGFWSSKDSIRPGDEVLVLPKIDVKSRQIAKDLTQILFQIAVSAKVILGL